MLKFFFWLLVLANGALFAYHQGYLDKLFPDGREPGRAARQFNADRIRLLPAQAATARVEKPVVEAVSVAAPQAAACIEVGDFSAAEAKRIEPLLALLSSPDRVVRRTLQESARYIVLIPPQGSKEGADKKIAQLRQLGVADFYAIQDDSDLRWGVSLGIFKSEDGARARLEALNRKGVRSARIMPYASAPSRFAYQVQGAGEDVRSGLEKLKTEFLHAEIRDCASA